MRAKVKLLFTRLEGVKDASIDEALRAEANELDRKFPGRLSHCRAYLVQDEALERTAAGAFDAADHPFDAMWERSDEHTSELHSLMPNSYAVFCLPNNQHTQTEQINGPHQ